MTELKQYRVGPDDLVRRAERATDHPVLAVKLHDLSIVYHSFADYVAGQVHGSGRRAERGGRGLAGDGAADGRSRVGGRVYRFYAARIGGVAGHVARWRTGWTSRCASTRTTDDDLFAPTRETYERLLNMAAEDRMTVEEPVVFGGEPPARFRSVPMLAHLERELFKRPGRVFAPDAVTPEAGGEHSGVSGTSSALRKSSRPPIRAPKWKRRPGKFCGCAENGVGGFATWPSSCGSCSRTRI